MSGDEVLHGVLAGGVQEVAAAPAAGLDCSFDARESDYLGDYILAHTARGDVKVVAQPDPEGDPLEDALEQYEVLVYSPDGDDEFDLRGVPVGQGVVERLN